jgi:energy-coupling factor transporter transmembrane protein EcfT
MIPAPPHEIQESHYRWRGAVVACGLNAVGMPLDFLMARGIPNMPGWPPLMSSAVGVILAIVLFAGRRHPITRLSTTAFVLNTAAILVSLWITSGAYAAAPGAWIPFQANKLGALAAGVLAPDLATGLIAIGGFAGMAMVRYMTFPIEQRERLPIGEPWVIVIYAIFAIAMMGYRLHSVALARRMLRVRTESIATQRMAKTFLAVRDLRNTPLQTIELAVGITRRRCPDLGPVLDRIDRALDRLYRLNHAFSVYESQIAWTEDDVSPDSSLLIEVDPSRPTPRP